MLSSMLSFASRMLPDFSSAISSRIGATSLQGPHHSAQKSTSTGVSEFMISSSKELSVKIFSATTAPFGHNGHVALPTTRKCAPAFHERFENDPRGPGSPVESSQLT